MTKSGDSCCRLDNHKQSRSVNQGAGLFVSKKTSFI